jgi:hypothetical protein
MLEHGRKVGAAGSVGVAAQQMFAEQLGQHGDGAIAVVVADGEGVTAY